jgi:hypothetical protein
VRLDTPELAVTYAGNAIDAVPLCGATSAPGDEQRAACVRAKLDAVQRLHTLARMFHELHDLARDPRSRRLARELYAMVIPLLDNGATRANAQAALTALEASRADRAIDAGGRDGAALRELLALRNEQVATCYEAGLATSSTLAGTVGLGLELDATGAVIAVATEPAAGDADLRAVAGCVAAQARRWKFPLGAPGRTRIALRYTLSVTDAQGASKTR